LPFYVSHYGTQLFQSSVVLHLVASSAHPSYVSWYVAKFRDDFVKRRLCTPRTISKHFNATRLALVRHWRDILNCDSAGVAMFFGVSTRIVDSDCLLPLSSQPCFIVMVVGFFAMRITTVSTVTNLVPCSYRNPTVTTPPGHVLRDYQNRLLMEKPPQRILHAEGVIVLLLLYVHWVRRNPLLIDHRWRWFSHRGDVRSQPQTGDTSEDSNTHPDVSGW
jgi:hypothetical protein